MSAAHAIQPVVLGLAFMLAAGCGDSGGAQGSGGADVVDSGDGSDSGAADVDDADDLPRLARRLNADEARAGLVTDAAELIGGPKADGQVGDIKIYNHHVAFIVEGARRTGGYRVWGGLPVDIDLARDPGEPGRDTYGEWLPTWNLTILHPESVEVLADGSDGGDAHVRVTGATGPFDWATHNKFVFFQLTPTTLEVVYDYRLGPDDEALELTVTVTNPTAADLEVDTPFMLSIHGDGVFPWAPGTGFDAAWGAPLPYVGVAGRELAYAIISERDDVAAFIDYASITILQQDAYVIAAGASSTTTYWVTVSDNGASGLDQARRKLLSGEPSGRVAGDVVLPQTTDSSLAWVAAWQGDEVGTMAPVRDDGSYWLDLPPGTWTLRAYALDHAAGDPVEVDVVADDTTDAALTIPTAARVQVALVDAAGAPTAGRATFIRVGDQTSAPQTVLPWARGDWDPDVAALAPAPDGEAEVIVPGGLSYEVTASGGFTAELDTTTLDLAAGDETPLTLTVDQVVDTAGFVAGDFHVHGTGSWDSHVPDAHRAREAVAEGIAVPILTNHGWAAGLDESAGEAGVADRIAGPVGQEVTSFIYGHFNAFPLDVDTALPNRGAVYALDKEPLELFDAIHAQGQGGDRILQLNHPRAAALGGYFQHVGFNRETGTVSLEDEWTTEGWDAVEVFNGACSGGENEKSLADWVALTNLGHKKALSSGSDSHSEGVPLGMPRNYIQVDLGAAQADDQVLVDAVRARRMVVSCGPFVTFESTDGKTLGQLADTATFDVTVQAPSWMAVHELRLLENGLVIETVDLDGAADPVLRYDGQLSASPASDAWYAVEVVGSGEVAPVAWQGHPYALTNPIEVDADGDGVWTPPGL